MPQRVDDELPLAWSSTASHAVAMRVIQVPMSEMLWRVKKRWKLRWRSARHA